VPTTHPELRFSLVVPVYNEEDNVAELLREVGDVLQPLGAFEALMIDDGSDDTSVARMESWRAERGVDWLRIVELEQNRGQSAAVMAGVECASAPIVLIMDGDRQNDPRDFAEMLELVESGRYQAVTGLRARRKDTFVRRASSRIGNAVRNFITGDQVRDAACGIKVFRRSLFLSLPRFQGMHRFMATLARYAGADVLELPVNHRPREAGVAKYGVGNRALRGLMDCFAVRWYRKRLLAFTVKGER